MFMELLCIVILVLIIAVDTPPLLFLHVSLLNVLSKALAPLNRHGFSEPKLLLQPTCFVCASAAYIGCLLLASAAEAPSLSVTFPFGYFFEAMCHLNGRHLNDGNGSGH
jgi:hypothetical protein